MGIYICGYHENHHSILCCHHFATSSYRHARLFSNAERDPAARWFRVTRSIGLKMWLKTSVIHSCHRSWRGTNSCHGRKKNDFSLTVVLLEKRGPFCDIYIYIHCILLLIRIYIYIYIIFHYLLSSHYFKGF